MKQFLLAGFVLCGLSGAARADAASDFVFFDAQIAALQHRVDASASSGANTEAITALRGKQEELVNQEAKLKAAGTITPDEKAALGLSIRQQQQRLTALMQPAAPATRHVDPASLPAQTYVSPMGTVTSGAPGTSPAQNGVVMPEPALSAIATQPTVPVVHAPQPVTPELPQQ